MTDDIIVVVPPGTRVRFIENRYTDGKVLVVDAHQLRPNPLTVTYEISSMHPGFVGLPVFDAEPYAFRSRRTPLKRLALIPLTAAVMFIPTSPAMACGDRPHDCQETTTSTVSASTTTPTVPNSSTTPPAPSTSTPTPSTDSSPTSVLPPPSTVIDQPTTHYGTSSTSSTTSPTPSELPATGLPTDLALAAAIILAAGLVAVAATRPRRDNR